MGFQSNYILKALKVICQTLQEATDMYASSTAFTDLMTTAKEVAKCKNQMFIILTIYGKYPTLFHKVRESGSTIIYTHVSHEDDT